MVLPTLQGALKDSFGEVVMACDMQPCHFLSLDSCRNSFLWTHKEADLALHPVVGLVLKAGHAEKFFSGTWFQKPGSFFQHQQAQSMLHSHEGGWKCYLLQN